MDTRAFMPCLRGTAYLVQFAVFIPLLDFSVTHVDVLNGGKNHQYHAHESIRWSCYKMRSGSHSLLFELCES